MNFSKQVPPGNRPSSTQARRNRLLLVGGLVVILVAVAVGITVALTAQPELKTSTTPAAAAAATLAPASSPFELGPADAKIVVEEYGDYQCPYCKLWDQQIEPLIVQDYIKTGKSVKFVFRPFPFLDYQSAAKESHITTEAAYCAFDQGRGWDFHKEIYNNQPRGENTGYWTADRLKTLAKNLNLNTATFNSCLDSGKYKAKVEEDFNSAVKRQVRGTPTVFVNGKELDDFQYVAVKQAIDSALQAAK